MSQRDEAARAAAHVRGRTARSAERTDRRTRVTRLGVLTGLAVVVATALVVDGDRDTAVSAPTAPTRVAALMPASSPADAMASTWYCAAGTAVADGMADHTVTMLNPTAGPLTATVTVFAGEMAGAPGPVATDRPPVTTQVGLPAGGEVALRLADVVEAPLAAALVEVDGGDVAVEHRVAGRHGADAAPCSTIAASTWHLAWGATTRDARDVVVLFNPFPSSATVDAVFATEEGGRAPVRLQGLPVPAGSVVGVELGDDVTRSEQVSATFEARTGNVVVERLQEYDGSLEVRGLSLTPAVAATGETWVFPDGEASTRAPTTPPPDAGDEEAADEDVADDEPADDEPADDEAITTERVVVYNPGDERAEVDVQVIPAAAAGDGAGGDEAAAGEAAEDADPGESDESAADESAAEAGESGEDGAAGAATVPAPQPFGLSVGPGRYEVVDLGAEERIPPGVPHTTIVRSTNGVGVVAERVTVDRGPVPPRRSRREEPQPRRSEISATTGSRLAAPVWRFLSLGDPADDTSTVTMVVYNPDPTTAVDVRLDLLPASAADADAADGDSESDDDGTQEDEDATQADDDATVDDDTSGDDDATRGDPAGDGVTAPVSVAPGGRVVIELDAAQAAAATAAILQADGPVVVDRVLRLGDGRRRSLGGGVPAAAGAVALDRLAFDGLLGLPGGG